MIYPLCKAIHGEFSHFEWGLLIQNSMKINEVMVIMS